MTPRITVLIFCLSLSACLAPSIRDWPQGIPRQALFVEAYRADARNQQVQSQREYLEWIVGFYQGTLLYPTGWLDVEERLMQRTPRAERQALKSRLAALGLAIGSEWAKENEVRLIDNRMLSLWGSTLQLMTGFDQQMLAIDEIERDIDRLFVGTLQKKDVTESRYASNLGFEVFGDF